VPTILGEIKRCFRDRTWSVRVPRDLQELALRVDQRTASGSPRTARWSIDCCRRSRRARKVVRLRFEDDLTQAEIGELIGVSQMQVSRIGRRSLSHLRTVAVARSSRCPR